MQTRKQRRWSGWLCALALGVCGAVVQADEAPSSTPPAAADAQTGAIIPIHGEINDVTLSSMKRRVEQARADGARVLIFELNTPGGMVSSALDICDYIKNLDGFKTIAWIHTQAFSAGTMIALACDEIVMAGASTMGDCGVIMGSPMGAEPVPEDLRPKAESPVLEQFRDSARRRNYDTLLAEAFVVPEREVWWIENMRTGEREFVSKEVKEERLRETATAGAMNTLGLDKLGLGKKQWKLVESFFDPVSNSQVPVHQPIDGPAELLTLSQSRAYAFGFSKAIVSGEEELRTRYHLTGDLIRHDTNWSEEIVRWLTSMPVRTFLLLIIFLAGYIEFNSPGLGLPGLVALIGLVIFVGAPFLTGLANVWEIVAIVLGLILILLEIFVIPGFGVAGISGIGLVLLGLVATFVPEEPGRSFPIYWPSLEATMDGLKRGVITLAVAMTGSVAGAFFLARHIKKVPYMRGLIPDNPTALAVAYTEALVHLPGIGSIGVAESYLRPAGKVRFGAQLHDVIADGEFIDAGRRVEVVEHRGSVVVVRGLME